MFTFWLVLFVIGTAVLLIVMFFDSLGSQMPSACPRCDSRDRVSDGQPLATYDRWYRPVGARYRCRDCQTFFKNHPNGTLVEDRD